MPTNGGHILPASARVGCRGLGVPPRERGGWYCLHFLPQALVVPMSSWEPDPHADMVMSWGEEQDG